MACAGDWQEFGSRGDELQRRGHFIDGAKSIPQAMNEQRRGSEAWEVRCPQLARPLRRMERVREQQELIDETRFSGSQHGGLSSSIGVTTQEYAP